MPVMVMGKITDTDNTTGKMAVDVVVELVLQELPKKTFVDHHMPLVLRPAISTAERRGCVIAESLLHGLCNGHWREAVIHRLLADGPSYGISNGKSSLSMAVKMGKGVKSCGHAVGKRRSAADSTCCGDEQDHEYGPHDYVGQYDG